MKKRLLSLALALVLCLGLTTPALAAETITETLDNITVTANPNGTVSYTGTGVLTIDHLYLGMDMVLYVTDYMDEVDAVSINIGSGIDGTESGETFVEFVSYAIEMMGIESSVPITVNGSPVVKPAPAPQPAKPATPAPASKPEAIIEDLGDIQVTADPNGTLSYTGAGELTIDHLYMGIEMIMYVTDYMDGIDAVSINIAPGITYVDTDYYGSVDETFKMLAMEMGIEMPFHFNQPSAPQPAVPVQTDKVSANPNSATVLVNGKNVAFDAYNINNNNYFKLRDLAYALSGTDKQFEVTWDQAANAVVLTSGKRYTAMGGEMSAKGTGTQFATPTSSKILLDGKEVALTAYNINDNNYFKLRDIGQAFDIGIGWYDATRTITIDTSTGYTV